MKRLCVNCEFYVKDDNHRGTCHRYPPLSEIVKDDGHGTGTVARLLVWRV